jgi:hypothetical protein
MILIINAWNMYNKIFFNVKVRGYVKEKLVWNGNTLWHLGFRFKQVLLYLISHSPIRVGRDK